MVYPVDSLSTVLEDVDHQMIDLKRFCQQAHARLAAADTPSPMILDLRRTLATISARLMTLATTPGLAAYAQEQKNAPGLNIATEFSTVQTAISDAITYIEAAIPKSGTYLLHEEWGAGGTIINRQFTPVATQTLRTKLDAIITGIG